MTSAKITFGEKPYATKPWTVRRFFNDKMLKATNHKTRKEAEAVAGAWSSNVTVSLDQV